MTEFTKNIVLFACLIILIIGTGIIQSANSALLIVNMGLVSAVMSIGLNFQWGYAGLFNVGVMGFVALGGLATVLISTPPVIDAWNTGGIQIVIALFLGLGTIALTINVYKSRLTYAMRTFLVFSILFLGFFLFRRIFDPAVSAIESINPTVTGNLGGLGLPVLLAWPIGGLFAAGAAWLIGKTALGLRSDYLAIATLGIAEIIIAVLKHEDWLTRGVKNVIGLPRPVPYEIDLQNDPHFVERVAQLGMDPAIASTLYVKINYSVLLSAVLLILLIMAQLALKSPWGRMIRAIRDNEVAAEAMGKDVTQRHLQVFVLGSAIFGLAGAMMTTLDGQLTPGSYQPIRFTFLIWVMVIVGGSGNNFGAILGGFFIWFLWVQVEPIGLFLVDIIAAGLSEENLIREHLIDSAAHMRLISMGVILLLVLRFSPKGLIPEK
ncbi:MAG: branched-chain amino acid ABC transporter permease [Aestuariivita sp.]|nr:branched-chain amino acid ABC transporter permease [Aestuariivita sp.]